MYKLIQLPFWHTAIVVVFLASCVRGLFLLLTTSIIGDALTYSNIAQGIAARRFDQIDTFWVSLFCFWQSLFYLVGFNQIQGTILSSFIPGSLILIPIVWMAKELYGKTVLWITALLCIFHPRLVSYSTNGFPELFYIFALACGIAFLTKLILYPNKILASFGWGLSFGVYVAVRNEGLLLYMATLFIPLVKLLDNRDGNKLHITWFIKIYSLTFLGIALVLASYMALSEYTLHTTGLFQKSFNLFKQYSEQIDFETSAKEIYGKEGVLYGKGTYTTSYSVAIKTLSKRFSENIALSSKIIPTVLLSPIYFFILLLPFFSFKQGGIRGSRLPLLFLFFFPLLLYPLIQVEARFFFPILIPLNIFASYAFFVFFNYFSPKRPSWNKIYYFILTLQVLLNIATLIWIGVRDERGNRIQLELANWVDKNVPPNDLIVGDGYGYITKTGFLSHRPILARIWTEDPKEIVEFMKKNNAHWLIIYEPFLEKGNKGLLSILDSGLPGMKKVFEIQDSDKKRYQIYHLD